MPSEYGDIPIIAAFNIEGEKKYFMDNETNFNHRSVIVSDVEFAPYDPNELVGVHWVELCRGQIIVNLKDKTITFKFISGESPTLYAVLLAMSVNKHWCRMINWATFDYANRNHVLLRGQGYGGRYYVAKYGKKGLPVIDYRIKGISSWGLEEEEEVTLTTTEFCMLVVPFSLHTWVWDNRERRHEQNMFKKIWQFKYIKNR